LTIIVVRTLQGRVELTEQRIISNSLQYLIEVLQVNNSLWNTHNCQ